MEIKRSDDIYRGGVDLKCKNSGEEICCYTHYIDLFAKYIVFLTVNAERN